MSRGDVVSVTRDCRFSIFEKPDDVSFSTALAWHRATREQK